MTARYIAIDWGSTNLRAWLYQGDHCLESRQSEAGVTRLNEKSPAAVLAEVTADWREENTPVVMAGMVGSNVGWNCRDRPGVMGYQRQSAEFAGLATDGRPGA